MRAISLAILLMAGCWATPDRRPAFVLAGVRPGMTQAQVLEIAGEPIGMTVGGGRAVAWGYGSVHVHWGADGRVEAVTSP